MARRLLATTQVSLDGFYSSCRRSTCLQLIAREVARLGGDEDVLIPYQRDIYRDLWDPFDEWALAQMLNYWQFDLETLSSRGRKYSEHIPAKPRIDIDIELTTKGNLKAEWFPRGMNFWGQLLEPETDSDFLRWQRFSNRFQSYDSRPSNELFFIHDVEHAVGSIRFPEHRSARTQPLDHVFLRACSCVVEELKDRLEHHFDVRMRTDIFVKWQQSETDVGQLRWDRPTPLIVGWEIANPVEKRAEAERAELASMEQTYGFSAEALLLAWSEELERKPTGPTAQPHTLTDRITRKLKATGLRATRGQVERAMGLLRTHRTKACPSQAI